jgi:hypothetical protein
MIPVVQHRLPTFEVVVDKKSKFCNAAFFGPPLISKFFPSNRWGRKHIAHQSLFTAFPASRWFLGTAALSNVFSEE